MDLVVLQEHHPGAVEGHGRILDRLVEGRQLLGTAAGHVFDDVGLLVVLVADVVDVAAVVGHRPLVLADIIGQLGIGPGPGIPGLDIGIVVADIALARGETDALHRLVEEEHARTGVLDQVDHRVEVAGEHQLRRPAGHRHLEAGLAGARAGGFEIDVPRVGRPRNGHVRRFVEGQLHGLAAGERHGVHIAVALDVGAEGQPLAVRRDERRILHARHRDHGRSLSAGHRDAVDVPIVAEKDLPPVGRERRMGREADVVGGSGSPRRGDRQEEKGKEDSFHIFPE